MSVKAALTQSVLMETVVCYMYLISHNYLIIFFMPGLVDLQAEARWNKSCVPIGFLNEQDKFALPTSDCMP